jgi:hypothetical protein
MYLQDLQHFIQYCFREASCTAPLPRGEGEGFLNADDVVAEDVRALLKIAGPSRDALLFDYAAL